MPFPATTSLAFIILAVVIAYFSSHTRVLPLIRCGNELISPQGSMHLCPYTLLTVRVKKEKKKKKENRKRKETTALTKVLPVKRKQ